MFSCRTFIRRANVRIYWKMGNCAIKKLYEAEKDHRFGPGQTTFLSQLFLPPNNRVELFRCGSKSFDISARISFSFSLEMVDVIHTDAGILGANIPTGSVDFWPVSKLRWRRINKMCMISNF